MSIKSVPESAKSLIGMEVVSKLNGTGVISAPSTGKIVRLTPTRVIVEFPYKLGGQIAKREKAYRVDDGREVGANMNALVPVYQMLGRETTDKIRQAYGLKPLYKSLSPRM